MTHNSKCIKNFWVSLYCHVSRVEYRTSSSDRLKKFDSCHKVPIRVLVKCFTKNLQAPVTDGHCFRYHISCQSIGGTDQDHVCPENWQFDSGHQFPNNFVHIIPRRLENPSWFWPLSLVWTVTKQTRNSILQSRNWRREEIWKLKNYCFRSFS